LLKKLAAWWRRPSEEHSGAEAPVLSRGEITAAGRTQIAWKLLARQPLIGRAGEIAGWELRVSPRHAERLDRPDTPPSVYATYAFALTQAARAVVDSGRIALVAAPSGAFRDPAWTQQLPAGTFLLIDNGAAGTLGESLTPLTKRLRSKRACLAAPLATLWAEGADMVIVGGPNRSSIRREREDRRRWLMTDLPSVEAVVAALESGIDLCAGQFVNTTRAPRRKQPSPEAASAANVMSALVAGRAPREIAALVKGDVALSYRLLRYLNGAVFGRRRTRSSIEEAILLLGSDDLYRWLGVLLISADSQTPLARTLHEAALARGRLMELLARSTTRGDPPEELFMTGAFSLLGAILDVPLEVALAQVPVSEHATAALFAETGPWRPYLEIALAVESNDEPRLTAACTALGAEIDQVTELAVQASDWGADTAAGFSDVNLK